MHFSLLSLVNQYVCIFRGSQDCLELIEGLCSNLMQL